MIEIVGEALRANGIGYSLCLNKTRDFRDGGPLDRFKNDLDTRVLLLPLQLGAEGLDLVCASHVFLLDPIVNPYVESQAVNRVHRIGQTRPTYVHKYAVRSTVEEKILEGRAMDRFKINLSTSTAALSAAAASSTILTQDEDEEEDADNEEAGSGGDVGNETTMEPSGEVDINITASAAAVTSTPQKASRLLSGKAPLTPRTPQTKAAVSRTPKTPRSGNKARAGTPNTAATATAGASAGAVGGVVAVRRKRKGRKQDQDLLSLRNIRFLLGVNN
jgi:hypothetical protein